ncbi:acyltransferase [Hyphobacterium sp. HN65]|uniref:Acyltransferase n=1 Tax=Hyphobacterium lacteum TaxID=3116575 RepID=A0ABU7LMY9_9PROT|nr:acyltransferase [Hyphobacterium sp. HN65]MEE2525288.1 acyltransferase [Hyphobacterium sp. HN65]
MAARQLTSIQVLRGLAALGVVIGHLWQIEVRFLGDELSSSTFLIGFAGVDLFFVLSGFVMVHVTRDFVPGPRNNAYFLYKRITRIYPPYWVFTALMLLAIFLGPNTSGEPFDPSVLPPSLLLLPQAKLPVLAVGWTLVHEMYFYLVFTALLFLPRHWLIPALAAWLGVIVAGTYFGLLRQNPTTILLLNPLTVEFLLGAAIAYFQPRLPGWASLAAIGAGILGLAATAITLYPFAIETFPAYWTRLLVFGLPVTLIVLGTVQFEPETPSPLYQALVKLGDWSYSLYLGHLIFLAAGAYIWNLLIPDIGWIDNLAMMVLGVAGCIIAAGLTYTFIEQPLLAATRRLGHRLFRN